MGPTELHLKYRPASWAQVVGHDAVVKSIQAVLGKKSARAFLLTGPSGVGKTTIARLIARTVGVGLNDLIEVDGATTTGIDAMREVVSRLQYKSLTGSARAVVIDECFHSSTLVATEVGPIKISELRVGDSVHNAIGKARVKRIFKNRVALDRLIRVDFENDTHLFCSCDHKVLTPGRGWIPFNESMGQYTFSNTISYSMLANIEAKQEESCHEGKEGFSATKLHRLQGSFYTHWPRYEVVPKLSKENLSKLWGFISEQFKGAACLLKKMWEYSSWEKEGWPQTSMGYSQIYKRSTTFTQGKSRDVEKNRFQHFTSYDPEQSNAQSDYSGADGCHEKSQWDIKLFSREESRRQRSPAAKISSRTLESSWSAKLGNGTPSSHSSTKGQRGLSNELQNRHCKSKSEDSSRGGWRKPLWFEKKTDRFEKDLPSTTVRVEGLSYYKSGAEKELFRGIVTSCDVHKGFVELYDLEIDGHPSYFANGILVHNCHAVSKQSFQSLLKALEEPVEGVHWALCTTEPDKVPKTVKTRCVQYDLKPLNEVTLQSLLMNVRDDEGMEISDDGLELISKASEGSPRQALVLLASCGHLKNLSEVGVAVRAGADSKEAIDLCRLLFSLVQDKPTSWGQITQLLRALETPPETTRVIVLRYMTTIALSTDGAKAAAALDVMDAFSTPFLDREGNAPLARACATVWAAQAEARDRRTRAQRAV